MLTQSPSFRASFIVVVNLLATTVFATDKPVDVRKGDVNKTIYHHNGQPESLASKNLGNEIIYQIFVDRFANGNRHNDCLYEGRFCANGSENDMYRYQGGDLRGIINSLDYLKRLGVTRLWLTPIFENQLVTVQRYRFGRDAEITSYHGYWLRDWFQLNPFFTDQGKTDYQIVEELIHRSSPEIKIYLDTVFNHSNPSDATSGSLGYLDQIDPIQSFKGVRTHRGSYFKFGKYLMGLDEDKYLSDSNNSWNSFFHHTPTIEGDDWQDQYRVENYMLEGLSDFNQDNYYLEQYLFEAHEFWLRKFPDVAGFRIDTIKHVPLRFWQKVANQFYSLFPQLEAIGEYYNGGPQNSRSADFYKTTRLSMLDFNFRNLLVKVFLEDDSFQLISDFWQFDDPKLIDSRALVTFLDSHDLPRFRGMGLSSKRMYQMVVLWLVARGIPCIYYGLEQDLYVPGDPGDPLNRPMMRQWDESFYLYKTLQKLNELRKQNLALRFGRTHVVHESEHIYAFERIYDQHHVFFATSKNPRVGSDNFYINHLEIPDGIYKDLLNGREYPVKDGKLFVALHNGDVIVFAAQR